MHFINRVIRDAIVVNKLINWQQPIVLIVDLLVELIITQVTIFGILKRSWK